MFRRIPMKVEVKPYSVDSGLEDGFEPLFEVITKQWVATEDLVKIEKDGVTVCPYILTKRGRTFIAEHDYIIIEEDGTKLVCGAEKVFNRYEEVEE